MQNAGFLRQFGCGNYLEWEESMLLRRITIQVRDQNWLAVAIDFVIVVIGVFIGIQASSWNDMRAERLEAHRLLDEVVEDLEVSREELIRLRDIYHQRTVIIDDVMSALEAGSMPDSPALASRLGEALSSNSLPEAPVGLERLLVSSRLDLIEREPVRDALQQLALSAGVVEQASATLRLSYVSNRETLAPYLTRSRSPAIPARPVSLEAVDIDALWASRTARSALDEMFGFSANMQGLAEFYLASVEAVLDATKAR